ncbi:MAG TPA: sarcosine oxidase subunit delta [Dongiaceae bacterium]|jgi:sarcosine oxidase subunit delta|nr:sarcosine oxidase subunit delta [Dongiaceae bacterium]
MLRIRCPFCGERDHGEFTYGGDATVVYPDLAASVGAWIDAVYVRANPQGPHRERWQHSDGCRLWLIVERDTMTHEIMRVEPARAAIAALLKATAP